MRGTYITAAIIAVSMVIWLASGQLGNEEAVAEHPSIAEINDAQASIIDDKAMTVVRGKMIEARPTERRIKIRGRTENKRTVEVRAETTGRVVERPVERGDVVSQGDVLCKLAIDDRAARVTEARDNVAQARIEYEGSLKLKNQGLQSETAIARAKAQLASAEARLASARLDVERTAVRAPFAGVVEATPLEVGDYAQSGTVCVTIIDLDPMLLVGQVSERDIHHIQIGDMAHGRLVTGAIVSGPITFLGQRADPATRTYRLEATLDNADFSLRSGITTEVNITVEEVMAHKVSPALFALNDEGSIGIRTVDDDSRVRFHVVSIIADDIDGVWVTGLPERTTLITVGQEFVAPGERVEVKQDGEMMSVDGGEATDDQSAITNTNARPS